MFLNYLDLRFIKKKDQNFKSNNNSQKCIIMQKIILKDFLKFNLNNKCNRYHHNRKNKKKMQKKNKKKL